MAQTDTAKLEFDQIINTTVGGNPVEMGCVRGSDTVLFIKTGQGGSIFGYENKYLHLAHAIRQKYGYSVFVSATVNDSREVFEGEMQIVDAFFGGAPYQMYYMGVSKGGLIGCWYGADYAQIKRMMTVNAPLMINFHNRTLPSIKRFEEGCLTMIYGSLDASYRYVPFVEKHARVKVIENADHNMSGMPTVYEELAEELLN